MIKILKGDTSADISFALAEGFDYSGATVHVEYQGAVKTFTGCAAGDVLALRFSADETAVMSLGSYPVSVRITNPSGMVKTIQNANTKICVTDDPAEVSGGAIALDVKGTLYGIEDLPERWTEADIVAKLREIMRRGGAVLCALLTFSAFGASFQTARKDAICNDAQIVTNVTFDGLAPADYAIVSNRAMSALQSLEPSTNYTDNATNAIRKGFALTFTNDVCAIVTNTTEVWVFLDLPEGASNPRIVAWGENDPAEVAFDLDGCTYQGVQCDRDDDGIIWFSCDCADTESSYYVESRYYVKMKKVEGNALGLARMSDVAPTVSNTVTKAYVEDLGIESGIQEETDPIWTGEKRGYATTGTVNAVSAIVNAWEGYWDGTNVIFEVTNYYGNTSGEIPRLRIKELRDGAWQTVWDEANKFSVCETNILTNVVKIIQREGENFAPIAWGTVTDKGTPNVVNNCVWMTSPETYFAGGTEYQRVAVGSGAICVLVDNGAGTYTAGEEGTFRFQDEGGTNYFGFAKSDSYTIGCRTDGIAVEGTLVTLRYDVIMGGNDVPIIYYRQTLSSGEWVQLNNADGTAAQGAPYAVTWYTSGGSYYAAINCGSNASGFFKAETSVAGDVVFETNMKARLGGGIECENSQTGTMGVIRPTYNGSAVSWTWSAK